MYGCFKELTTRHPLAMDFSLILLFVYLQGKVNVYTMDHRGTGKSTHLKCEKTQSAASELQDPTDLDPPRIPACAKELEERYGDLAAFSTTSAAMDLASFISDYGNDFSTTVYGLKYGSLWVERLMHLNPPEVTGYVSDGPTTTSGAALENFYNVSSLNVASSEVADAFLDLCAEDSECNAHFGKKGLKATLAHLKARLDNNPTSTCAKLVTSLEYGEKTDPPSMALQNILGTLLGDMTMRTLIPPIVYM
ncbi:hypothetical protein PF005_g14714 [Phytophthora fragariae]|nr:hypothetical protein PF009_g15995 [Phytophthora fragariae]KAE9202057.1 hypothetical protein PF005_g14714 [Phytophthora fragariae]KAE9218101.1 hypothetical protein PF004_g13963 [Phytophthora fragariae]KAE9302039.1 hypothetical protein PF001_g14180 [Phytophthora fragariae]